MHECRKIRDRAVGTRTRSGKQKSDAESLPQVVPPARVLLRTRLSGLPAARPARAASEPVTVWGPPFLGPVWGRPARPRARRHLCCAAECRPIALLTPSSDRDRQDERSDCVQGGHCHPILHSQSAFFGCWLISHSPFRAPCAMRQQAANSGRAGLQRRALLTGAARNASIQSWRPIPRAKTRRLSHARCGAMRCEFCARASHLCFAHPPY